MTSCCSVTRLSFMKELPKSIPKNKFQLHQCCIDFILWDSQIQFVSIPFTECLSQIPKYSDTIKISQYKYNDKKQQLTVSIQPIHNSKPTHTNNKPTIQCHKISPKTQNPNTTATCTRISSIRPKIKYKTNFTNCISDAFQRKGYERTQTDDWDIIWSQKQYVNQLYERRLKQHQRINHFRNYYQLCRKDMLIRNLKKYRKNLERDNKGAEAQMYNFYPVTYILPSEYVIFADQFKRYQSQDQKKNVWIMKPIGKSQGKGIFLFNKLSQISQWENHSAESYIVQKYISDPLLLGGKKFDMRIYALVTSYSPLTIYLYRSGFARFTHMRYDQTKINQSEIHLTNVAIQKHSDNYDENLGGKWYLDKLKIYLNSKFGHQKTNSAFYKVQEIIVKTLQALQKVMASDRNNSFQLYGFDILFDSKLDPWLIEVNGSPSMTANTPADYQLKMGLLQDTLLVIDMEKFLTGAEDQIGGFDLICKGKPNKNNQIYVQKISFLGTYNNRLQNLKKIAKNSGTRLNQEYSQKSEPQIRKLATTTNTQGQSSQNSKRSIGNNMKKISKGMNQINPLGQVREVRDFVIKHKMRKETNQNQLK